jgi:hypothetical protein
MSGYTIAAIPTLYRGRMYRSRLEARWAAFFDRLGWAYEYEPFDLGAWSPDFLLTSPMEVLVEVKPIEHLDKEVTAKMLDATNGENLLLTRVAPVDVSSFLEIGWSAGVKGEFSCAAIVWVPDKKVPRLVADITDLANCDEGYWRTLSGDGGRLDDYRRIYPYASATKAMWADASNAVQWEPKS